MLKCMMTKLSFVDIKLFFRLVFKEELACSFSKKGAEISFCGLAQGFHYDYELSKVTTAV